MATEMEMVKLEGEGEVAPCADAEVVEIYGEADGKLEIEEES